MKSILHLSDLHLGDPTEGQFIDQHKNTIASGDRRAERDVLKETLEALLAEDGLADVEAIVVSGDLTNGADASGLAEFEELGEMLATHVPREQILVVPGNHDVPREHGPGDPERYTAFLRVTRDLGFATPLLDSVDFNAAGGLEDEARAHPHVVVGKRFVILPLNSSHFCWGTEPLPATVFERLLSVDPAEVEAATEEIRRYDVPRISNAQMSAVEQLVAELDLSLGPYSDDGLVCLGALHHQLLPVSAREEFKAFESLTNLGAVREFLVTLGVQVVLHGHKHESALYWDYVADQQRLTAPPARVLVSAAPGTFRAGLSIARTLQFGERASAPEVRVDDIFAAERKGGPIRLAVTERALLWDDPTTAATAESRVIRGDTPSEVYERVQSIFAGVTQGQAVRYLICEIANPYGSERIPADYHPVPGNPAEVQAWMTDLVEWWQLRNPQLSHGVTFNHGERIYKRWGDQVKRAAEMLSMAARRDPSTTRAAILLLDPRTESSPQTGEFPSFVSVQLQLVPRMGAWRLDCTGSFRKQEMGYWWPINVAELAGVQKAVADQILIGEQNPRLGLLRTITAHAIVEERLPAVAVPAVDRAVDQRPEALWRMAYSLIDPGKSGGTAEIRSTWDRYLAELRPRDAPSKVPPMSRRGLQTVLKFVQAVDPSTSTGALSALKALVGFYALFDDPAGANPKATGGAVTELLDALDHELDTLLGEVPDTPVTP